MGAGNSTPDGSSTKHVFASETPVSFSQELVDSLQASSETNSTRAKSLDLHIAQRVADELEKIQKRETDTLNALKKKLAEEADRSPASSEKSGDGGAPKKGLASLLDLPSFSASDLLPFTSSRQDGGGEKNGLGPESTAQVESELEKLREQLGKRKTVQKLPREVEDARERVIGCLRVNDRRPLDCWREVEAFKEGVRGMEREFVGKVL